MIKKIVHIRNCGKIKSFIPTNDTWNGILEKVNTIYADNGTGKTTFTQIFKSLSGDNDSISKRLTFGATGELEISLISDKNKPYNYRKKKWNSFLTDIEIFDTFYIESNVYIISLGNYDTPGRFYKIIVGKEGIELTNRIVELKKRKKISVRRRNLKNLLKKKTDKSTIEDIENKIETHRKRGVEIGLEIAELDKKLIEVAEKFGKVYLDEINKYLRFFNPNIKLTELNKKGRIFVYYLEILGYDVRSESVSISLKHTLSEGDKSSLALSFFLAQLSLLPDLKNRIVIFDDPISSFDSSRRNVTINQLHSLTKKVEQFILLSHDIGFLKDFCLKNENCQNLKMVYNGSSSIIINHDLIKETMTGIFKDLTVMHNFLDRGAFSEFDKREIIRCIRPSIEGIFRIKFFKEINSTEWLGDIIRKIRNSGPKDTFFHLKVLLEELSDINDYSKSYHHSNPNYLEIPINDEELRVYVERTLSVIKRI